MSENTLLSLVASRVCLFPSLTHLDFAGYGIVDEDGFILFELGYLSLEQGNGGVYFF